MKGLRKVHAGAAIAVTALLSCASAAQAQRPPTLGAGAPSGQMGVQLYDWNNYLNNGAGEITCPAPPAPPTPNCVAPPAPSTNAGRLERVFQYLASRNVRVVELYGYPGNPFPGTNPATPINTAGLQALKTLGDQYGLRFPSRHGNIAAANWDNDVAASKIVGQEYIGAADAPPGYNSSYANTLAAAQLMNQLGKRSVEAGLGPVYFHNHQAEFTTKWMDNGVLKSAEEIMLDRTDPRYVKAQIDIFWAISGGADVTAFVNKYQDRLISYHVKDGVDPSPSAGPNNLRALGQGTTDFTPIFAASKNRVKYYLYEYDPVNIGTNGYNPFSAADTSFAALKGDPAPVAYAAPATFPSVPAGTLAANNVVPIVVKNVGDAPLTITNTTLAADANDGGNQTRDDFQVVSQSCFGTGTSPLQPAATCTVNVGFRPSRTDYTSVARLQIVSNSDDAVERVPLYGKSTRDALTTVGGDVPSALMLQINSASGSFGTFVPATARTYETALAATITTTTGDAALSVSDASTTAPGHLVNGAFSLPSPLNARAINSSNPTQAFAPLAEATGTTTTLLNYANPTTSDVVTLGFRQAIGAGDVLRAGTYGKQLTFTLSTTTP